MTDVSVVGAWSATTVTNAVSPSAMRPPPVRVNSGRSSDPTTTVASLLGLTTYSPPGSSSSRIVSDSSSSTRSSERIWMVMTTVSWPLRMVTSPSGRL